MELMSNPKIFVIAGGFYYFGDHIESQDGFVALKNLSMFGGFSGGLGLPGVCSGRKGAKVTLDRFAENAIGIFPISACYGILPCINLYEFDGTTLR